MLYTYTEGALGLPSLASILNFWYYV